MRLPVEKEILGEPSAGFVADCAQGDLPQRTEITGKGDRPPVLSRAGQVAIELDEGAGHQDAQQEAEQGGKGEVEFPADWV